MNVCTSSSFSIVSRSNALSLLIPFLYIVHKGKVSQYALVLDRKYILYYKVQVID